MTISPNLAMTHPLVAKQWHPEKNGELTPEDVVAGSHRKVWWFEDSCNHEWEAQIVNRSKGSQCPICAGKQVLIGFNDVATTHPHLVAEWHDENTITPLEVTAGSNKVVKWHGVCGHEWSLKVCHRTSGNGCPYCSGRTVLEGFNDLSSTYPEIAASWDTDKNQNTTPKDITYRTGSKFWWRCALNHEWEASVSNRVAGSGCPICDNKIILPGFNDLASKNPELAARWHPTKNYPLTPNQVAEWSQKRVWWVCSKGHEWEAKIAKRHGCPICSGQKVLVGYNDFESNHKELAKEWHPTKNGSLLPHNLTTGSNQKVWWLCIKNHEYNSTVHDRAHRGYGCNTCTSRVSKAEQDIFVFITSLGLDAKQSDRKTLASGELDILIPEKKIAIEFNGLYWHTENRGKHETYHYEKWKECKDKGIQLIQIWEDEWNEKPSLLKRMLAFKLGLMTDDKVAARKTFVADLTKTDAEVFLEENHIQGFASGSFYVGLKAKDTEEIVALVVLKKEPGNALNIIRYATNKNVVGGFTKLLSYAINIWKPSSFITFSDNCVSDGGLYKNNGFIADKELRPDYRYVVAGERKHKFGYRLKRFQNDPNLLWESNLTEKQLADLNGISRIWDAGKIRWIKTL